MFLIVGLIKFLLDYTLGHSLHMGSIPLLILLVMKCICWVEIVSIYGTDGSHSILTCVFRMGCVYVHLFYYSSYLTIIYHRNGS